MLAHPSGLLLPLLLALACLLPWPKGVESGSEGFPPLPPCTTGSPDCGLDQVDSVYLEELTWIAARDRIAAGARTAILITGGVEENGPYVVGGKHNYIARKECGMIAHRLGNALCAPVLSYVPEGSIRPPSMHMFFPPTLSLRPETYVAVLTDITESLLLRGFDDVFILGNSGGGGNQRCLSLVADALNSELATRPVSSRLRKMGRRQRVYSLPEYYSSTFAVDDYLHRVLGILETPEPFVHDDFQTEAQLASIDPALIRTEQRERAGLTTISGVSILPTASLAHIGEALFEVHTGFTAAQMKRAISSTLNATVSTRK
jgi:creatinine amidohydrolase